MTIYDFTKINDVSVQGSDNSIHVAPISIEDIESVGVKSFTPHDTFLSSAYPDRQHAAGDIHSRFQNKTLSLTNDPQVVAALISERAATNVALINERAAKYSTDKNVFAWITAAIITACGGVIVALITAAVKLSRFRTKQNQNDVARNILQIPRDHRLTGTE